LYTFVSLGIRCAVGGHGKVQFAVQTQFLIQQIGESSHVFCLGTSGAVSDKVQALDLVVATRTVEHDFNLKFFKSDKPSFRSDQKTLETLKALKPKDFKVYFGVIASGDEDVLDPARSKAIHDETGALVTAWEGAGGARVCKFLSVPYVEIRAVSDSADGAAPEDFKKFLSKSMANLASLVILLQENLSDQKVR